MPTDVIIADTCNTGADEDAVGGNKTLSKLDAIMKKVCVWHMKSGSKVDAGADR